MGEIAIYIVVLVIGFFLGLLASVALNRANEKEAIARGIWCVDEQAFHLTPITKDTPNAT